MRASYALPATAIWPMAFVVPGVTLVSLVGQTPPAAYVPYAVLCAGAVSFAVAGKMWTHLRLGATVRSSVAAGCWMMSFLAGGAAILSAPLANKAPSLRFLVGGAVTGSVGWCCQRVLERSTPGELWKGVLMPAAGFGGAFVIGLIGTYILTGMLGDFIPWADRVAATVAGIGGGMLARGSLDGAARLEGDARPRRRLTHAADAE